MYITHYSCEQLKTVNFLQSPGTEHFFEENTEMIQYNCDDDNVDTMH